MCLLLALWFGALLVHPDLELRDGFALHGELDVGIGCVDGLAGGVAHEGHADLLQDARLHEPGVEGVAQVVEADVADARPPQGAAPPALDDADGLALVGDDGALALAARREEPVEAVGQRDLPRLALRRLRARDGQHPAREVDVLPGS